MDETKKPAPKKEEVKQELPQAGIQGFLLPPYYRKQSLYRNHPLFRITSLIIILVFLTSLIMSYEWLISSKLKKEALAIQKMETDESTELQNQTTILKPVRDKNKEIDTLKRQIRIPLAPVLDSIEKTIPEKISINKISALCPPLATTVALKRKMQIQMEVYIPNGVDAEGAEIIGWIGDLKEAISKKGLKTTRAEWGNQKKFTPTPDQEKRMKGQELGMIKELTITLEREEQK